MRTSFAAHVLVAAFVQAQHDLLVYEDAFVHETCLVQRQGIRSKKFTLPSPAHRESPKQATGNAASWSLVSTMERFNHTFPDSLRPASQKMAAGNTTTWSLMGREHVNRMSRNPISHHREDAEHSGDHLDTRASGEVPDAIGEGSGFHQPPSQGTVPVKSQTHPQNTFEHVMKKAGAALMALRTIEKGLTARLRSVPEGALIFCVFVALAVFIAFLAICASVGNDAKKNAQHEYNPMPMPVIQRPTETIPDRISQSVPVGRVPPGARPNAPARRSDASSKSPDSSLNMSRSSVSSSTDSKSKDKDQAVLLCPSLVVPRGMDLVFAIRAALNQQRQELDFNILDLQGAPLCRVVVAEKGERKAPCCGIFLQTLTSMPLAVVNTEQVYAGTGPPSICRPNGSLFGVLKHNGSTGYTLKHTSGRRLLEFSGDFRRKSVTASDMSGLRVCVTEPDDHGYQIRIGPRVDAGMVISCLLGIDKLEGFALSDAP